MQTFSYRLTFHTPAFLGNAEQAAQWRTPPIKALLRQWWRVVYAAEHGYRVDVAAMRRAEGRLFGHAWLEDDRDERGGKVAARRSEVRLRLSAWEVGTLKSWEGLEQQAVRHPEVERTGYKVGPHAYLGFGPLDGRGGTKFADKVNAAVKAGASATLALAAAPDELHRLQRALALINLYGTLGGRSRNGWGSLDLKPLEGTATLAQSLHPELMIPWTEALRADWPQAIGSDRTRPLIWQTAALPDWKQAMRQLAEVKIALRTQQAFKFPNERPDGQVHARHWLSYPVTKHEVSTWKRDGLRLPNSLRFKVRPSADGKALHGVIFHMPCLPPPAFRPDPKAIEQVWQRVHAHLDGDSSLLRIAA